MLRWVFAGCLAAVVAAGCATGRGAMRARQAVRAECYEGSSQTTLPDGRLLPPHQVTVERVLDPAKGTIVERIHVATAPPRTYRAELQVEGDRFHVAASDGAYEGTGTLVGTPWAWSAWHSTVTGKAGLRVESEDTLRGGVLRATKRVVSPDGQLVVRIVEELKAVAPSRCESVFDGPAR